MVYLGKLNKLSIDVGDTVKLKSGGPQMTVEKIIHYWNYSKAQCV